MALEEAGMWPAEFAEAIVHLIPKPTGGRRPVGLLPSLVRVWERIRKPVIVKWRRANQRDYGWMREGRGAERSVWTQSVLEEPARGKGCETASVLLDLVKAFEQVALSKVWKQGLKHKMPRKLLVLSLEACAFGRRLTYKGAVSGVAKTLSAILAGGGQAVDLLLVTLMGGMDEIMKRSEELAAGCALRGFLVVDDVRLVVEGPRRKVCKGILKVTEAAVQILEASLLM